MFFYKFCEWLTSELGVVISMVVVVRCSASYSFVTDAVKGLNGYFPWCIVD